MEHEECASLWEINIMYCSISHVSNYPFFLPLCSLWFSQCRWALNSRVIVKYSKLFLSYIYSECYTVLSVTLATCVQLTQRCYTFWFGENFLFFFFKGTTQRSLPSLEMSNVVFRYIAHQRNTHIHNTFVCTYTMHRDMTHMLKKFFFRVSIYFGNLSYYKS